MDSVLRPITEEELRNAKIRNEARKEHFLAKLREMREIREMSRPLPDSKCHKGGEAEDNGQKDCINVEMDNLSAATNNFTKDNLSAATERQVEGIVTRDFAYANDNPMHRL